MVPEASRVRFLHRLPPLQGSRVTRPSTASSTYRSRAAPAQVTTQCRTPMSGLAGELHGAAAQGAAVERDGGAHTFYLIMLADA
jgi:hypothetical protein